MPSSSASEAPPRVILIDDDHDQLDIWQRVLVGAGFSVTPFSDPHEALRAIKAGCDCVVTDQQMPGMTGIDLVRACGRHNAPAFILMTGNPSAAISQEALEAGVSCVLAKPAE